MPLGGAFVWDLRAHLHVILTALNNDRHPEAPARLRGPRRIAASPYVRPPFEARFARTSVTDESFASAVGIICYSPLQRGNCPDFEFITCLPCSFGAGVLRSQRLSILAAQSFFYDVGS